MKGLFALLAAVSLSVGSADAATLTRKIDTTQCDTVYTNYYFFLDANTASYFNKGALNTYRHNNIAQYTNNSYQIKNFDARNVGYGQVAVNANTSTSGDRITSMSLEDFYYVFKTATATNGAYSNGTNNFIVAHNWYNISNSGNSYHTDNLSIQNATLAQLRAATINADATITHKTGIYPTWENPLEIQIERSYFGYLTGSPVTLNNNQWYFHPALYYVQYCSPKSQPAPVERYYNVYYRTGTTDTVANMPNDSRHNAENDMFIDSKIPTRSGYTFLGWTTDSASPVPNTSFNPGSKYTDRKDLILYAVWKKNEQSDPTPQPPDNPQTGVTEYLVPFGGVLGASGIALNVLKKKKGFKQF